eukprot:7384237-Prymnesium_polylepis.2
MRAPRATPNPDHIVPSLAGGLWLCVRCELRFMCPRARLDSIIQKSAVPSQPNRRKAKRLVRSKPSMTDESPAHCADKHGSRVSCDGDAVSRWIQHATCPAPLSPGAILESSTSHRHRQQDMQNGIG